MKNHSDSESGSRGRCVLQDSFSSLLLKMFTFPECDGAQSGRKTIILHNVSLLWWDFFLVLCDQRGSVDAIKSQSVCVRQAPPAPPPVGQSEQIFQLGLKCPACRGEMYHPKNSSKFHLGFQTLDEQEKRGEAVLCLHLQFVPRGLKYHRRENLLSVYLSAHERMEREGQVEAVFHKMPLDSNLNNVVLI